MDCSLNEEGPAESLGLFAAGSILTNAAGRSGSFMWLIFVWLTLLLGLTSVFGGFLKILA
jgi:hypothetical protein